LKHTRPRDQQRGKKEEYPKKKKKAPITDSKLPNRIARKKRQHEGLNEKDGQRGNFRGLPWKMPGREPHPVRDPEGTCGRY